MPTDQNRRVLVVDDNRSIHDDFRKILSPAFAADEALNASEAGLFGQPVEPVRQTQFEVDSAYQGEEGLLLVRKALDSGLPYAMAFIDVRMPPGWDGVETTRRIWEYDPDLQVVLCTAYSDYSWDDVFESLAHRDGLLILKKPFDSVEAFQMAHALTEKWGLHREARRKMEDLESRVAERTSEMAWQTALLEAQVHSSSDGILVVDEHGKKILQNQRIASLFKIPQGIADDEDDGEQRRWVAGVMKDPTRFLERVGYLNSHPNEIGRDEIELTSGMILDRYSAPVMSVGGKYFGRIWTFRDITERKRLETQLIQSQKLETVGRLAGGIAHEFNSILTAIIGQSELLLGDLPAGSPLTQNAHEISKAAGRAAVLTRQLLAYGRKQFLQPESLDLNHVLANMEGMFHHLMGGDVTTQLIPAPGLRAVRADAGQIEQVIVNMAINARDAMPNGGKLILETAAVSFDEETVGRYPELRPGDYVMLAITDSGTGMSEEVRARVFEPFYSTKGAGPGAGLGLSTCYGIVKQSGGHISVYSETNRGTTFKIYLPQVECQEKIPVQRLDSPGMARGTETILLVEDDPALRQMAATLLRRLGYKVLAAANGIEALGMKQQPDTGHIDLLFTDVVMPHMSGKELADRMRVLYPHTRILFTSAYTENAIVQQGVLDKGVALLQKPFAPSALARKVREVLDQPSAPNPSSA